ncbi:hypothetical protein LSAT2_005023 [Lamellibrachia satsuma]|nr:hypothetical protein LSAT2_005023 [Lamellibrachia satsuma]
MQLAAYVGLIIVFVIHFTEVAGLTECEPGHGYPDFCPQLGEAPNRTRCCKHYLVPTCCEERASHVCLWSGFNSRSGNNLEPGVTEYAVYCPRPGQSGDNIVCCNEGSNHHCCSTKLLGAILGGAFGGIALIAFIIIGVIVCVLRSGRCVCVKVGPSRWQMMSRVRAEEFNRRRVELPVSAIRPR